MADPAQYMEGSPMATTPSPPAESSRELRQETPPSEPAKQASPTALSVNAESAELRSRRHVTFIDELDIEHEDTLASLSHDSGISSGSSSPSEPQTGIEDTSGEETPRATLKPVESETTTLFFPPLRLPSPAESDSLYSSPPFKSSSQLLPLLSAEDIGIAPFPPKGTISRDIGIAPFPPKGTVSRAWTARDILEQHGNDIASVLDAPDISSTEERHKLTMKVVRTYPRASFEVLPECPDWSLIRIVGSRIRPGSDPKIIEYCGSYVLKTPDSEYKNLKWHTFDELNTPWGIRVLRIFHAQNPFKLKDKRIDGPGLVEWMGERSEWFNGVDPGEEEQAIKDAYHLIREIERQEQEEWDSGSEDGSTETKIPSRPEEQPRSSESGSASSDSQSVGTTSDPGLDGGHFPPGPPPNSPAAGKGQKGNKKKQQLSIEALASQNETANKTPDKMNMATSEEELADGASLSEKRSRSIDIIISPEDAKFIGNLTNESSTEPDKDTPDRNQTSDKPSSSDVSANKETFPDVKDDEDETKAEGYLNVSYEEDDDPNGSKRSRDSAGSHRGDLKRTRFSEDESEDKTESP
ncbi:hypothetical protein Dda_3475 [Drechslerella dactyloides]|uniref:Uncharacterized protein n=1 Tax=Drechslerella dactyloides TaxID=74499 RepID=A0AAD6J1C5_DREDA|nr:hypothetical protein Dda_3475 [Drechslerella dactyloides]